MSLRQGLSVGTLLVSLLAMGCGSSESDPNWPDPVKVTGKISYQGKPFANGTVMFIPEGETKGQGGSVVTNENGEYTMQTRWSDRKLRDGLIPGKYKVAFKRSILPDGTVWVPKPDSTEGPASAGAKEEMPLELSEPAQAKFDADVTADKSTYDFDLN